jgi:TonB family protein
MRRIATSLLCGLVITSTQAFAQGPTVQTDDVRAFEAEKNAKVKSLTEKYLNDAKAELEQAWAPPHHSGLLVTKFSVVLDATGKIKSKRNTAASGSGDEDQSADTLLDSFSFHELPGQLQSLALNLSFMSDGSVNIVKLSLPSETDVSTADEVPPTAPRITRAPEPAAPVSSQPDFDAYMEYLQGKLKQCWFPPRRKDNKKVVVRFGIDRMGVLSHVRLDHSSGVTASDQAALKAVQNAAPFRPLPNGAAEDLDAQFVFGRGIMGTDIRGKFLSL